MNSSSTWGAPVEMYGDLASCLSEWYLSSLSALVSSQQLLILPLVFDLSNMSSKTVNTPGVCFHSLDLANFDSDLDNAKLIWPYSRNTRILSV